MLVWVCDLMKPCLGAIKAAASCRILVLVGYGLPHENMFLDTLLVVGLLAYKTDFGLQSSYLKPLLTPSQYCNIFSLKIPIHEKGLSHEIMHLLYISKIIQNYSGIVLE